MTDASQPEALRDASVIVARDSDGAVAVLAAEFPLHGGEYVILPGGRREPGRAVGEGRFLLQGGPLALLLAQQITVA